MYVSGCGGLRTAYCVLLVVTCRGNQCSDRGCMCGQDLYVRLAYLCMRAWASQGTQAWAQQCAATNTPGHYQAAAGMKAAATCVLYWIARDPSSYCMSATCQAIQGCMSLPSNMAGCLALLLLSMVALHAYDLSLKLHLVLHTKGVEPCFVSSFSSTRERCG